jgi:antibiotic biosynthesis monooxygenase (ABM) superfamily enzyme
MSLAEAKSAPDEHSEVTSVVRHTVRPGKQEAYEAWLREIVPLASHSPGHRGVNVIRPSSGSTTYTVVLHFDTIDNLRDWLDSEQRRKLIDKAMPLLVGEDNVEIKTGLEFWFTPPSKPQGARPYKQLLVTLSAIYPLTLIVPLLLNPVFGFVPALNASYVRQLFVDAAIVALLIYVIMPRYTRLLAKWLYG